VTFLKRLLASMPSYSADGASTLAPRVDRAFSIVLYVGAALGLALVAGIVFALIGRRASSAQMSDPLITDTPWFAVIWCTGMLAIACALFWVGYVPYLDAAVAPADAYEIQATSQKGSWSFAYPSGKVSINQLVVPRWRPVRLVMSSKDNLHNFYLPQFRLQQTAIPGRYTSIWFEATEAKTMPIQCTEDCPGGHVKSLVTISIVEPDTFDRWLALKEKSKRGPASPQNGAKL